MALGCAAIRRSASRRSRSRATSCSSTCSPSHPTSSASSTARRKRRSRSGRTDCASPCRHRAADQYQRIAGPNQHGTSRQFIADIAYPFAKSRAFSASARASLSDWKSEEKRAGSLIQRDRLQVARAWIEFSRVIENPDRRAPRHFARAGSRIRHRTRRSAGFTPVRQLEIHQIQCRFAGRDRPFGARGPARRHVGTIFDQAPARPRGVRNRRQPDRPCVRLQRADRRSRNRRNGRNFLSRRTQVSGVVRFCRWRRSIPQAPLSPDFPTSNGSPAEVSAHAFRRLASSGAAKSACPSRAAMPIAESAASSPSPRPSDPYHSLTGPVQAALYSSTP